MDMVEFWSALTWFFVGLFSGVTVIWQVFIFFRREAPDAFYLPIGFSVVALGLSAAVIVFSVSEMLELGIAEVAMFGSGFSGGIIGSYLVYAGMYW